MPKTFHLEIVTPDGLTFQGEVESLVLPAWEGQLGVLPGHAPTVAALQPGAMRFRRGGKEEWLAVSGGFAEITPTKAVVLAETAELAEAIDAARAKAKAGEKQQALSGKTHDFDVDKMQASLVKELVRLKVAEKVRKV